MKAANAKLVNSQQSSTTNRKKPLSGKGAITAANILHAAEQLIINEGYHKFSMRKVAANAKLTLGNLQYYYPTKDNLISDLMSTGIQRYIERFQEIRKQTGIDPVKQFSAVIAEVIRDLNEKNTTLFFPEMWVLANHYDHAVGFMDNMYEQWRLLLADLIRAINPSLGEDQIKRLAVFISSSIEGHTMFIGYKKPWQHETNAIVNIATQSFLWLIESGDIPE